MTAAPLKLDDLHFLGEIDLERKELDSLSESPQELWKINTLSSSLQTDFRIVC